MPASTEIALPREALPRHVAIIMDGNGRWAVEQGKERIEGHARGVERVREIVTEAATLGIGQLTLYSFSSENWKRPKAEVDFLMSLFKHYLIEERPEIMRQNIRFRVIGRRSELAPDVIEEIERSEQLSAGNTGLTLALAVNYGSRSEILDAVRDLAGQVQSGTLKPGEITEELITNHLYTAGMPDPDLLIRSANEMRISNYLLWQISYAEFWVTPVCWPDFDVKVFHQALRDFASRQRRFGGLTSTTGPVGE
ncbi:isoprenyl transferase [Zavarzinella formosa]|uniref:isoprenyl transferase n=1 Tax=Zavarzinella formosa TaxID=360055 RepID=UPI00030D670C|nr:isoprenyl transferase [Zavarzinella formosa]